MVLKPMEDYLRQVLAAKTDDVTYLRITTITILASFNKDVDINMLRGTSPVLINGGASEWKIKPNKFFNQITFETYEAFSKKSIKIFPNGSVHVTGCSDLIDCRAILKKLSAVINHLIPGQDYDIDTYYIAMINGNFSMRSFTLNLRTVIELFGEDASFNPETYSSVKIKRKDITISVFASGSVIITGAKDTDQLLEAYSFLASELTKAKLDTVENRDTEHFDSFRGYTFHEWKKYLQQC
jgi:TATA-box binding protein (TBP) (component of TFIID and TFIIIB)